MGRLQLAAGPTNSLDYYVNVPTDYGTVISQRKDLFLGELCALDSQEDMYAVLDEVWPYNQHLGLIDDAISLATDVWEAVGPLLDKIKKKNPDTGKPAVVPAPDPAAVLKGVEDGVWIYKQGALYFGPKHPFVLDPTKHILGFKEGVYATVAPDQVIAKLDPEYKAEVAKATSGSGSGTSATSSTKSKLQNWLNNVNVQHNAGGGYSIDLNNPWYRRPEIIIPGALVGGFLLSRLLK